MSRYDRRQLEEIAKVKMNEGLTRPQAKEKLKEGVLRTLRTNATSSSADEEIGGPPMTLETAQSILKIPKWVIDRWGETCECNCCNVCAMQVLVDNWKQKGKEHDLVQENNDE